jgi:DNA-directed RNA polymerase beta subunit
MARVRHRQARHDRRSRRPQASPVRVGLPARPRHRRDRRGDPRSVRRRRVDPQLDRAGYGDDRDEALIDLYRKLRPGEPTTVESARGLIQTLFRNPKRYDLTRVGRYKLSQKFGEDVPDDYRVGNLSMLRDEDIVDSIKYLVALHAGSPTMTTHKGVEIPVLTDDIDHFGNRRIRTVGELIQNQIRVGL